MLSVIRIITQPFVLAPLILALCLLFLAHLPSSWSEAYSQSADYHFQVEAFLQGQLRVGDAPAGHSHDWIWGHGLQQNWGLGTPALMTPFLAIGKVFGFEALPDQIFFFALSLVAAVIFSLLLSSRREEGIPAGSVEANLENTTIALFFLAQPTFLQMLRTRFLVYEEAVAIGILVSALAFGALCFSLGHRRLLVSSSLCFALGFLSFFRPTAAIYALITWVFLTGLQAMRRNRRDHSKRSAWRVVCAHGVCFAVGPLLHLLSNQLRFGSWREFGYSIVMTSIETIDYPVRFDNPMKLASFWEASKELVSCLFSGKILPSAEHLAWKTSLPWQASALRFHELYFTAFVWWEGVLVGVAILTLIWILFANFVRLQRPPERREFSAREKTAMFFLSWGTLSFCALFLFYLKTPAITSRYVADFVPACAALFSGLYLLLMSRMGHGVKARLWTSLVALLLVLAWIVGGVVSGENNSSILASKNVSKEAFFANFNGKNGKKAAMAYQPSLPTEYRCGTDFDKRNITHNLVGWNANDCSVFLMTSIFFAGAPCVELDVSKTESAQEKFSLEQVRVRRGLHALALRSVETRESGAYRLRFCEIDAHERNPLGYEMISIAWLSAEQLNSGEQAPVRLLAVRATQPR